MWLGVLVPCGVILLRWPAIFCQNKRVFFWGDVFFRQGHFTRHFRYFWRGDAGGMGMGKWQNNKRLKMELMGES